MVSVGQVLHSHVNLRKLILRNNVIGNEGVFSLCAALEPEVPRQSEEEEKEEEEEGKGGRKGAMAVSKGTLEVLDLSDNVVQEEGGARLGKLLRKNQSLVRMWLGGNRVMNEGARGIAEGLKENGTLQGLFLQGNGIEEEGARALLDALQTNQTLVVLYLAGQFVLMIFFVLHFCVKMKTNFFSFFSPLLKTTGFSQKPCPRSMFGCKETEASYVFFCFSLCWCCSVAPKICFCCLQTKINERLPVIWLCWHFVQMATSLSRKSE